LNYIYMERVETNMKLLEDNLSTYNGTMDRFYTQALSKIEIIKGLITTIRSDIEQYQIIQKQYNDSLARVQALQGQIEGLLADIERLQKANDDLRQGQEADVQLRQQLEALQKELRELRNEQANLKQQLGIAKAGNEEKDKQIEAYSKDIKSKDDEIARLQQEINDNQGQVEIMRENITRLQYELREEQGREQGLEEQMKAYGDRIVELNTLLQQLSGDPRAEEVQKGLDDIIGQLRGLTNNSGSDDPGPGPAPGGPPERSSIINSSSASAGEGIDSGSTPTPGPNSASRPGTADSESSNESSSESSRFVIGSPLEPLGDTTRTNEERASSTSEEQKRLAPRRLPPISRSAHKVLGVNKQTEEDISIDFPADVRIEDMKARTIQIENIVDRVYRNMDFTDDQKIKKRVKGEDVTDYPHTIRMAASVGTMNPDEKQEMRKNVRKEIMDWQNTYTREGKKPFENFYLSDKKEDKNYSPKNGIHDPFNVEFPYYESKYYKIPMGRPSSKGGKTKGKKTRRKQGGKSKNKTIRYKRRKNRKQSKK
jgi:predicted  nucleic acid-binding Zn-ribbon protein